ncbi:MAG: single-stranded DNA-binding protein [Defluviitaleaceae bacterium]|nr:single-stranded DNA-binding protein [Defluviitaleaceae bacterium]
MNKVIMMGNLARDPETRYSQSADPIAVTRYSLAVRRRFKREGEPDTDFFNCVAFGKQAEFAEKYLKKGMKICIAGSLRTSSWDDKQTGQKRWSTDIVVEEQDFAESKASFESRSGSINSGSRNEMPPSSIDDGFTAITQTIDDEDLPF